MSQSFHFAKHFTVDEANELLPTVRRVLQKVQDLVGPKPQRIPPFSGNGNGSKPNHGSTPEDWALSGEERIALANELLQHLQDLGIVVQDWRRGLVDFPHVRDGREVFLCYEFADGPRILFYHELDAGYAGRKPIADEED
ncbi:MAG: DUF2203 domain-containing protein [Candidatus Sumerlaea chitinivorans]|nr:DUF2203 domain-containing protein [Candidatus Sumerlaea chitinivorans]